MVGTRPGRGVRTNPRLVAVAEGSGERRKWAPDYYLLHRAAGDVISASSIDHGNTSDDEFFHTSRPDAEPLLIAEVVNTDPECPDGRAHTAAGIPLSPRSRSGHHGPPAQR